MVLNNNKVHEFLYLSISQGSKKRLTDNVHLIQLYVEAPPASSHQEQTESFHPFAGYFLPYPEQDWGREGEGLVSTIMDEPPQLNWIYVDQDTYEIKYGTRLASEDHLVGPWDCTKVDKRLTLEGWEGFMAVEVEDKLWAIYFDQDDDGLKTKVSGKRILEIELSRKEMRSRKGEEEEG